MDIRSELAKLANPVRATGEKKYLKSPMKHFGVTVPLLHKIVKKWVAANQDLTITAVLQFTAQLWESEYHEERWIATDILTERRADLTILHLPYVEHMVRTAYGWAQLDDIAAWLVGQIFEKSPRKMTQIFHIWIEDDNLWVRRAAILGQLIPLREGRGDFRLFTELTVPRLSEKEFFIRKAIGWVLRERCKKVPLDTYNYVVKFGDQMSGLTFREATRRLPAELQNRLTQLL